MVGEAENSNESGPGQSFFVLPDAEKLEAMAEFAAGAGHEINNPLATIIGRAQLLLKEETNPQRRQMLMAIGAQAYRIRDMIGDTMLFGRPPTPEFSAVNLADIVEKVAQKLGDELLQENCILKVSIPDSIVLKADSVQLSVVLSELLRNSRQSLSPNGGEIQISAIVQSDRATISLVDWGKGFTAIEQKHAFDQFFSGRQAGRGLGFGLPKCWRIINQHHGDIAIESSLTGPTTVRFTWPIA